MDSRPRHASRAIVKTSRVSDRSLCKKKHPDFSDALGDRRIEEIQPPRIAGASPAPTHLPIRAPNPGQT